MYTLFVYHMTDTVFIAVRFDDFVLQKYHFNDLTIYTMFRQTLLLSQYSFICEQYFKCSDT